MDELLEQFLIEGRELVDQASGHLLALARGDADAGQQAARIDGAFRAVHTLKGSVGLFDFAPMGVALHAAEDVMGALRAGLLAPDRAPVDAVLDCIAAVEGWIAAIARAGVLPPGVEAEAGRLQAAMRAAMPGGASAAETAGVPPPAADTAWLAPLLARDRPAVPAGRVLTAVRYVPDRDCFFRGDDPLALARAVPDLILLHVAPREPWRSEAFDPFACNLIIELLSAAPKEEVVRIFRLCADQVAFAQVEGARDMAAAPELPAPAGTTLRIDAARIDTMAGLVGELIVAKNGLAHLVARAEQTAPALARALRANHAEFERLLGDLHRGVSAARMVTLTQVFGRLARLVRETAGRLGKPVAFETRGGATEADKAVVDGLYEPLLHLLRNAVDHGVESAAARQAAGKPPAGRIVLEASRVGNEVVITVTDDGPGLDPARLRRAAREKGLLPAGRIDALDDREILDVVFAPGFSTAATVTDISGRGVGLDAVRSSIEGLGGRVSIASVPGAGSTVRIAVPQAVTVTTVIAVRAGEDRVGVKLDTISETVRVPHDQIVAIGDGVAFARHGRTVPLLRLATLLGQPDKAPPPAAHASLTQREIKALIVESAGDHVAVAVDALAERIDVVIRPLEGLLIGVSGLLGTALLGDGSVLMVADLPELIGRGAQPMVSG
jgi:two-component system chemotaxis sensor kinase CheA